MLRHQPIFKTRHYIVCLLALGISGQAFAGAYSLFREYNAVEIGNSGSGGAAIAQDASTAYANPAGLIRIPNKQLVLSADPIYVYNKFNGSNTRTSATLPAFTQTGTATSNMRSLIPGFYYAMPLTFSGLPQNRFTFGFSVTTPFGLSTDYSNNSVIRYSSTLAKIQVIDISPSLGYKINDKYSIGLGIDFEHMDLDFRSAFGAPAFGLGLDSVGKNVGEAWGWGYHVGLLGQLTPQFRAGFTYHSSVNENLTGYSSLSGRLVSFPPGAIPRTISLNTFHTNFVLPASAVLSGQYDVNPKLKANGSLYYTWWSQLPGFQTAYNLAGLPPITPVTTNIPQHYDNAFTLALGGSYDINQSWLVRAGVSYDQSPVKSRERNVTLPDSNKFGLSIGAHFTANKRFNFDFGWTHLFPQNANVSVPLTVGSQTSRAVGSYTQSYADIFGLQANFNIV